MKECLKMTTGNNASININRILTRTPLVVAALAICLCFFACTQTDQQPAGPAEKVTIAYATAPYTVLIDIAQAQGYFRQEGLEVVPQLHSYGKLTLDALLAGKADFATIGETPFMFAVMKGEKISVIVTIQNSNKNNAVIARKDSGIRAPRDLKGRRIAVTSGTIGEFYMDTFLAANGISRKDVKIVFLSPARMLEALTSGEIDAASTWNPDLILMQRKLGDKGTTFYNEDIYTQNFQIVASQDYIRKNPERVRKVLRALVRAEEFVGKSPAEAQKIVAASRQMERSLLGDMWQVSTFNVKLDQSLVLALEDESRWAIKAGLTRETKMPNYLDFIYLDGLTSVKPEAVRILR
ncbi:MAG: NrtA/SsuA/CpmA family ABC transporter substrate-binding protein [Nitrospirae bacterium]|nr:NrtA/SsuA/CpmA family ABC transporter substrate-binding protein [Nitrospirota bacterium]